MLHDFEKEENWREGWASGEGGRVVGVGYMGVCDGGWGMGEGIQVGQELVVRLLIREYYKTRAVREPYLNTGPIGFI